MSEINILVINKVHIILSHIWKEDLFIFSWKGHLESAKAHHNCNQMLDLFFVHLVFLINGGLRHFFSSIQVKY